MLTGYYDLALCPPTYDFVSFLQHLECVRVERKIARCRVVLLPGPVGGFRRDKWWPHTVAERQALSRNIVMPLARLLPSCVDCSNGMRGDGPIGSAVGYGSRHYGLRVCVNAMRKSGPTLRAPNPHPDPRLVTITLRECEHWPERNSRLDQWVVAARHIEARGYRVVFMRDTLQAAARIHGFECNDKAAIDVVVRANLYASAACNLGVSNGPMWLALALGAPLLLFRPVNEASANPAVTSAHFKRSGIEPGGQVPGALPSQRIIWAGDDSANIIDAFDRHVTHDVRNAA